MVRSERSAPKEGKGRRGKRRKGDDEAFKLV
jgi:hypothetical protein